MMKIISRVLLFTVIVFATQYLFIVFIPTLVFAIAKHRKPQPVNTVYHAPRTDATARKVVLPNPDFIYSACFFDLTKHDLLITGQFADSTQYNSLGFYDDNLQPFYVRNNLQGFKKNYTIRLSAVNRVQRTLRAATKQGVVLMRILANDSAQIANAKKLQQFFKVQQVPQNE